MNFNTTRPSLAAGLPVHQKLVTFLFAVALAIFSLGVATAQTSNNPVIYGLSTRNTLVRFSAATPGSLIGEQITIRGLQAGENVLGIDFRPRTGQLYALGSTSRLYTIDTIYGNATQVGTAGAFTLSGANFGFDFNPAVDRIRVVSNTGQNLRLHPDTGALVAADTNLAFAAGDPNAAATPNVVGAAYTNNHAGTTATTLYDIDAGLDALVTQNPPNTGTLNTVGLLGVEVDGVTGFDIASGTGTGYFTASNPGTANSTLYTVNLTTGLAAQVGVISPRKLIMRDISVFTPASPNVFAVTGNNALISFNSATPATVTTIGTISGLQAGENILGIDFRPANGLLYALGSTSRLYTLNTATGAATPVGTAGAFTLSGAEFGFDFNPVPDRIRVVSDADQNLRLNPNDGTLTAADTNLAFAAGDPNAAANPNVVASGYINNFAGTTATTLYGIDSSLDILVTQNPPNNGTLNTVGSLGFDTSTLAGLDVAQNSNVAYASLTAPAGTTSSLYAINLTTGAATLIGAIGGGNTVRDIAVAVNIGGLVLEHNNIPSCRNIEYARIFLNAPAPAAGTTVTLTSANPAITVPASIVIPAGETMRLFSFTVTTPATAAQTGNITATYNGITSAQPSEVRPVRIKSFTAPASITGGTTATGTVVIDCAAPSGGFVVNVTSSNNGRAAVPASFTIPAGATSGTFSITTTNGATPYQVNLRASGTDYARGVKITVTPAPAPQPASKGLKTERN